MCSTFSTRLLAAMAASLAVLSLVRALTIDNQLTVIKNGKRVLVFGHFGVRFELVLLSA